MFYRNEGERVVHMVPGQGWRLVLAMAGEEGREPKVFEEPVIAWAIVEMNDRVDFGEGESIQKLVPLVRDMDPKARGYLWEFSEWDSIGTLLLAPNENRDASHDGRARKRLAEVIEQSEKKYAKWEEAKKLRIDGMAYEGIAQKLGLPLATARAIALQADKEKRG